MRSVIAAFAGLVALALASTATGQPPAEARGDWKGVLATPTQDLTLVFHVGDKVFGDSPDQNVNGIPATFSRNGEQLRIDLPMVGAYYEYKIIDNGAAAEGVFYQGGGGLPLKLARTSATPTLPTATPVPAELRGEWEGKLVTPIGDLTLRYHLTEAASVDIVEQNVAGAPTRIEKTPDGFKLTTLSAVVFTAKLSADGKTLSGDVGQGGQLMPLSVTRK